MARSLPIPIGPLGTNKKTLGSLQPKSLTGSLAKASSAALRRASYAERDRNRSVDPGALDFTEEDEVDDEDDVTAQPETEGIAKSMQRALKILQKGSETPGAGKCPWCRIDHPLTLWFQACGEVSRDYTQPSANDFMCDTLEFI